jgi:hypothetical protein
MLISFAAKGVFLTGLKGSIDNCLFSNINGPVLDINGAVSISDSIFDDNNCQTFSCVSIRVFNSNGDWYTRNVTGNTFSNNRGSQIVLFEQIYGEFAQFWDNSMFNNTLTNPNNNAPLAINGNLTVSYNRFDNKEAQYEVNILTPDGNPDIDLTKNWWGSTEESFVKQVIT